MPDGNDPAVPEPSASDRWDADTAYPIENRHRSPESYHALSAASAAAVATDKK